MLTAEQQTRIAKIRNEPKVRFFLKSLGSKYYRLLDKDDIESLYDWVIIRAALTHDDGKQDVRGSIKKYFGWEVQRLLRERNCGVSVKAVPLAEDFEPPQLDRDSWGFRDVPIEMADVLVWMKRYLSKKQERVLRLLFLVGLTPKETARVVGHSVGAVFNIKNNALAKLRQIANVGDYAHRENE